NGCSHDTIEGPEMAPFGRLMLLRPLDGVLADLFTRCLLAIDWRSGYSRYNPFCVILIPQVRDFAGGNLTLSPECGTLAVLWFGASLNAVWRDNSALFLRRCANRIGKSSLYYVFFVARRALSS